MNKRYLHWLMEQAQLETDGPDGYSHLCGILQDTYFLSMVEMDENRGSEGRELRDEWSEPSGGDKHGIRTGLIPYTCTMMELILVLARRMGYEMADSQYEAGTGKWVAELMENAGLATFRNEFYELNPEYHGNRIRMILNDIIYRRYSANGEGGFFPMKWARGDQRRNELLVQMNDYLAENYDIC